MYHRIKIKIFAYGFNLAILESSAKVAIDFYMNRRDLNFVHVHWRRK